MDICFEKIWDFIYDDDDLYWDLFMEQHEQM